MQTVRPPRAGTPLSSFVARIALFGAMCALVGCGQQVNELAGSITATGIDLKFSKVVATASATTLTLTYMQASGNIVCKLVVNDPQNLPAGKPFSLTGDAFTKQVTLSRFMPTKADGSEDKFADVVRGSIDFSAVSTTGGGKVAGSFLLFFTAKSGTTAARGDVAAVADGRADAAVTEGDSLRGTFSTQVDG